MCEILVIQFDTVTDELTQKQHCEAVAMDPERHVPVVKLPVKEMGRWLAENGYACEIGASGVWRKVAA